MDTRRFLKGFSIGQGMFKIQRKTTFEGVSETLPFFVSSIKQFQCLIMNICTDNIID